MINQAKATLHTFKVLLAEAYYKDQALYDALSAITLIGLSVGILFINVGAV